jgi:hypothetical protein
MICPNIIRYKAPSSKEERIFKPPREGIGVFFLVNRLRCFFNKNFCYQVKKSSHWYSHQLILFRLELFRIVSLGLVFCASSRVPIFCNCHYYLSTQICHQWVTLGMYRVCEHTGSYTARARQAAILDNLQNEYGRDAHFSGVHHVLSCTTVCRIS